MSSAAVCKKPEDAAVGAVLGEEMAAAAVADHDGADLAGGPLEDDGVHHAIVDDVRPQRLKGGKIESGVVAQLGVADEMVGHRSR